MSNSIYPAFNGLSLQAESTTDVDVAGMVSQNAIYNGSLEDIQRLNWNIGTPHPTYAYVGIDTFRITSKRGGWGQIELRYKGAFAFGRLYYARQKSLVTIPVQQASNFAQVAGSAASPQNGAIFDTSTKAFTGWKSGSAYEGLLTLDATKIVVTETSVTASPKDGPSVGGQPDTIPGPYSVGSGLFMGPSNTQIGGICYRNVLTWQNIPTAEIPIAHE
ncbi:hypothetical protein SAMN05444156_3220 [Verrucomicrobium sp. GAS474]|uniref:hypothetical protein n=1 Tax=Verrucomicrobium sp. GAS474 TaxID=1882831 RepID=UPI00087BD366|nr:hypothetical protein [Verrucomicrobium sp. GAS474]SDU31089.1 hypothetical protein SAMN05444156_3220 [Verrucomicrobium sp. GAS474]